MIKNNIVSISLKIDFVLANSGGLDEMQHYATSNLGIHCLSKYPFRGFMSPNGLQLYKIFSKWLIR